MVIAPFFSRPSIAANQSILHAKAHDLRVWLQEDLSTGRITQLDNAFEAFAMDVICELVMGMREHVLRDRKKAVAWTKTLRAILEAFPVAINFPFMVAPLQSLPSTLMEKMNPSFALLTRFIKVRQDSRGLETLSRLTPSTRASHARTG